MNLGLEGRCAVVTGGSKGIGRAIALGLAAEGVNVAICARSVDALATTADELREADVKVHSASCDVSDPSGLDGFLDEARAALGRIDILVNNVSGFGLTDDDEGWRASLDIDVMPSVRATWKVVPWMKERGGGSIVHIASIAGLEGGWPPAYAAAKAALVSHAKSLAIALAAENIRVNTVSPGSIEFPGGGWEMVKETDRERYDAILNSIPSGRLGTPEEVANAIVFLTSDRASWITGASLIVDGGQHRGNL